MAQNVMAHKTVALATKLAVLSALIVGVAFIQPVSAKAIDEQGIEAGKLLQVEDVLRGYDPDLDVRRGYKLPEFDEARGYDLDATDRGFNPKDEIGRGYHPKTETTRGFNLEIHTRPIVASI